MRLANFCRSDPLVAFLLDATHPAGMVGCGEGGALIEALPDARRLQSAGVRAWPPAALFGAFVSGGRLANKLQDLLTSPEISKTARAVGTTAAVCVNVFGGYKSSCKKF